MPYNPAIHHRRSIRLKGYDYSQAGAYFITICCEDRICRFGKIENDEIILNEYGNIAYNEWTKLSERFTNFELDVFQIMPNQIHGIIVLNDVGATLAVAQNTPAQNENDTTTVNENVQTHPQPGQPPILKGQPPILKGQPPILKGQPPILKGQPQGIAPTDDNNRARVNRAPTVGDIVGAYKSLVANVCLEIFKTKNVRAGLTPAPRMGKLWQRNYHEHIIRNEQSYQTISGYIINNPAKWADDKFFMK